MPEVKPARETAPASTPTDLGLVARLGAKARRLSDQAQSVTKDRDALKTETERLRVELEAAKKQADGNAARKEADQLRAELRTIKHRQTFDQVAKDAKVRPEALEDLYRLSEYKAEADVPDPEAIKALIAEQAKTRPFLFGDGQPAAGQQQTEAARPGPGRGQGGNALSQALGKLQVTRKDMQNPLFMRANSKTLADPTKWEMID